MSERMADEEFEHGATKAHITGLWGHVKPLIEEARRARASEAEKDAENAKKDAVIKALADALAEQGDWRGKNGSPDWHTPLCWSRRDSECTPLCHEARSALRLAGRP